MFWVDLNEAVADVLDHYPGVQRGEPYVGIHATMVVFPLMTLAFMMLLIFVLLLFMVMMHHHLHQLDTMRGINNQHVLILFYDFIHPGQLKLHPGADLDEYLCLAHFQELSWCWREDMVIGARRYHYGDSHPFSPDILQKIHEG